MDFPTSKWAHISYRPTSDTYGTNSARDLRCHQLWPLQPRRWSGSMAEAFCNLVDSMLFELKGEISNLCFYTAFVIANWFSMVLRVYWCVFSDLEWFLVALERKNMIFSTAKFTKIPHWASSAPPLGTPKLSQDHVDRFFCPALPSSWPVWNMSSFGGRKVHLIEKELFLVKYEQNRGVFRK